MKVNFPVWKGRAECTFDCPCGAKKRKRSFTAEHTVNPFNKNSDGSAKVAAQVMREAQEEARLERDQFLTSPLCKRCEDALGYRDLVDLGNKRRASPISSTPREASAK